MPTCPRTESPISERRCAARLAGGPAEAGFYWGPDDGGTNAAVWARWVPVGIVDNAEFAAAIGPLEAGWRYYYRAGAQRGLETGWAGESASFVTTPYTAWAWHLRMRVAGYTESETVRDFPLLVTLGGSVTGFSYESFGGSWYSLRFTDGQGRRLPYEVQRWDTNGESVFWVKMPELTSNAVVDAWWGNPAVTQSRAVCGGPRGVGRGYEGVWHLEPDLADASGRYPAARDAGSTEATGAVLQGRRFDGRSAYVDPGFSASALAGNVEHLTLSLWARPEVANGTPFGCETLTEEPLSGVVSKRAFYLRMHPHPFSSKWMLGIHDAEWPIDNHAVGQWQMVTVVLSNGLAYGSVNDGARVSLGACTNLALEALPVLGLRSGNGQTNAFAGAIDELRLSPVVRSAAWVRAAYRTVAQAGSFIVYGAVEPGGGAEEDANRNGLPDAWERAFFGEEGGPQAEPEADWDGDGPLNREEYVAGTDPTNRASVFRLAIARTNGQSVVGFDALPAQGEGYAGRARFYDLLEGSNLYDASWLPRYRAHERVDRGCGLRRPARGGRRLCGAGAVLRFAGRLEL